MGSTNYLAIESDEANPLDAITIGGGPSAIVALRNFLKANLNKLASFERDDDVGGLWYKHTANYASLQVTTTDWTLHGVPIREGEPGRRASRDSIMQWCRIPGEETATFPILHNLVIRSEKDFPPNTKELVVIGAGPSSMDVAQLAATKTSIPAIYLAHRRQHLGLPDLWWPWAWKLGITEISVAAFFYGTLGLPSWLVDPVIRVWSSCWAWWNGVPEWAPAKDHRFSYDVAYALRSECLPAYRAKRLRIIIAEATKIEKDTLHFSNGVVTKPQMVVEATGWNLDMSWIPVRSGVQFAELQARLFGRFVDMDFPGLYWISIANGFMCANHNADMTTQCVTQILKGTWKQPSVAAMEKQIKDVVLTSIFVPGRALAELRACGFDVVRG
ncbi:hypothetical protein M427DRAFT_42777 [Gonapodya prolifera JEL478]|uniref:FAD/NAD(P)-binding domain-containing protein n=1 Tax=Gonapodya prolifera (strain JEL478) TaxID=1344416 RepID=A0A139AND8_GONPJ|nr:hypothetical protein M427DRAFT_42777 [Gonapodya prolifera JEL478]|eukprot:KXS18043.1 hypothetical protein M427DRAFT_42777 [Gonapodya prolifera JEL478]